MNIPPAPPPLPPVQSALMRAAQELETTFLAEMLRAAGLGESRGGFGGGAGEDHFQSFLVREQARGMVAAGGIGLTDSLFAALADRSHDA